MNKKLLKKLALTAAVVSMLSLSMTAFAAETYTVKSGDSLKKIAKQVYGDTAKWEEIYEANKASIKNPNIIYAGQVFTIPGAEDTAVEQDTTAQTTEDTTAAETETENTGTTETTVKNVPVGENPVKYHEQDPYDGTDIDGWRYTLIDGTTISCEVNDDYVADETDAYGITYRLYGSGYNGYNVVKQGVADYMVENPDSNFSNMIKQYGNRFVIITDYYNVRYDEEGYYPDWCWGTVECEPDDCIYMFIRCRYTFDFTHGLNDATPIMDEDGMKILTELIESVSENIQFS